MKIEDVKVGMKAILNEDSAYFRKDSIVEVIDKHLSEERPFCKLINGTQRMGNDPCPVYYGRLDPYIEPAKDNTIKNMLTYGKRTFVFLAGNRKGESVCSPSDTFNPVKGVALAYARALGQTVDDIKIEINPCVSVCKPVEDKPVFEVGETVRIKKVITNTHGIKRAVVDKYQGSCHKINYLANKSWVEFPDIENGGYFWHMEMLEKIPQPPKHEVIIDGVKYVRSEE